MAIDVPGILASIIDPVAENYYSRARTDVIKLVIILAGLGFLIFFLLRKR